MTIPLGIDFYIAASLIAQLVKNPPAMQETPVWFLGWEKSPGEGIGYHSVFLGFSGSSAGKESACNVGDLGLIPGWEDPLEKWKATHSSILTWRIPWTVQLQTWMWLSTFYFNFLWKVQVYVRL